MTPNLADTIAALRRAAIAMADNPGIFTVEDGDATLLRALADALRASTISYARVEVADGLDVHSPVWIIPEPKVKP